MYWLVSLTPNVFTPAQIRSSRTCRRKHDYDVGGTLPTWSSPQPQDVEGTSAFAGRFACTVDYIRACGLRVGTSAQPTDSCCMRYLESAATGISIPLYLKQAGQAGAAERESCSLAGYCSCQQRICFIPVLVSRCRLSAGTIHFASCCSLELCAALRHLQLFAPVSWTPVPVPAAVVTQGITEHGQRL